MNISDILSRTNLKIPFDQFLEIIKKNYPTIGRIKDYTPIFEGYEDANIVLKTDIGKYVLKIFAYDLSKEYASEYAKAVRMVKDSGVETFEIIPGIQGDITRYKDSVFIITKYFDGTNFQNITPKLEDILAVTKNVSILNTINYEIKGFYDTWGNCNLINEFQKTKVTNIQVINKIEHLVGFLKEKNLSKFSKSLIHGDIQRKHILKKDDKYCIIDYGCMRYDCKVYELSTLLAWFCLANDTWNQRDEIYEMVITEYTKLHKLSDDEISMVKPLIATSYAAYLLKTTELIENGDDSAETQDWSLSSKEMFEKCIRWINL